jgi:phospholipid/cholesterol/gamma-HCH transport system substrate-binding protein
MSKAFRVGLFVAAALAIFAAGVFLIGNREFLFQSTYRLNADFPNVAGLVAGADVRVGGLHEGTVRRIDLPQRPDEKVRVEMDLDRQTRGVVKKDSVASIETEGLVGDEYVEVSFGSDSGVPVNSGDTIQSQAPVNIGELIKKTDGILDSAKGAVDNVDQLASNLSNVSGKIDRGKGTLGALINDKSIYQHVNQSATELQEDMEALKHNFLLRGFFKKRGYEDSADLTKYEISSLPQAPAKQEFTYNAGKLFDKPTSAELKDGKKLSDAGKYLQQDPFGLAVVTAYTGMKGDTDKDVPLTEARAYAVREYLVKNYRLDDTRIKTLGFGKSEKADDAGEVDVLVYPPAAEK